MKNKDIISKDNIIKIFIVLLIGCAVVQFLLTQYFSIFQAQEHMGLDASWNYLKVILADKYGGIYPSEVMNQTTQPELERIIFVLPFYKITGNLWISYGLANILLTICSLVLLWKIMADMKYGIISKLLIINLFLCPYMSNGFSETNDLGYFSCVLGFTPYHNVVIIAFLFLLWLITSKELNKNTVIIFAFTILFTVFVCVSKGMGYLVWCGIPVLFYILLKTFLDNNIKFLFSWKGLMLEGVLASIFIGRLLGSALGYTYIDSGMNWINASRFWSNLGNVILGYMALVGAIPGTGVERSPLQFLGFVYVFGLIIFTVLLVAFFYVFLLVIKNIKSKTKNQELNLFLLSIIIVNTLEYAFIDTASSQDIFELRYLILAALSCFILLGHFIENLDDSLLFKKFGIIMLFISIVAMDLYSDYFLAASSNEAWHVDEIAEVVQSTDAGLVVFWDSEKEFVKTERVIRVVDSDRIYKSVSNGNVLENFGDYNIYDDSKQYVGPTILIVNNDNPEVPNGWLDEYTTIGIIGDMRVCYSKSNPIDILGTCTMNR